jgi:hypothetical protein
MVVSVREIAFSIPESTAAHAPHTTGFVMQVTRLVLILVAHCFVAVMFRSPLAGSGGRAVISSRIILWYLPAVLPLLLQDLALRQESHQTELVWRGSPAFGPESDLWVSMSPFGVYTMPDDTWMHQGTNMVHEPLAEKVRGLQRDKQQSELRWGTRLICSSMQAALKQGWAYVSHQGSARLALPTFGRLGDHVV